MLLLNGADATHDARGNRLLAAAVSQPIDDAAAVGDVMSQRAVDAAADAAESAANPTAGAVPAAPAPVSAFDAKAAAADAKVNAAAEAGAVAEVLASSYAGVDVRLCDFDDVLYRVCVGTGRGDGSALGAGAAAGRSSDFGPATAAHTLRVHMSAPFFAAASGVGALSALRDAYGAMLPSKPAPGADVTLSVDLRTLRGAAADAKDALVQRIAQLKCTAIGGVFQHFFRALSAADPKAAVVGDAKAPAPVKPFAFPIRNDTTVWFVPEHCGGGGGGGGADAKGAKAAAAAVSEPKVHITYSVSFRDRVDRAVALTFLREFVECETMSHVLRGTTRGDRPKFAFTKLPPLQVAGAFGLTGNAVPKGVLGYASFTVQPSQVRTAEQRLKLAATLQGFRTFLQYHVKCSKALFHSQMRARAHAMLTGVNNAKRHSGAPAPARTITGRYFTRRDAGGAAAAAGAAGAPVVVAAA